MNFRFKNTMLFEQPIISKQLPYKPLISRFSHIIVSNIRRSLKSGNSIVILYIECIVSQALSD